MTMVSQLWKLTPSILGILGGVSSVLASASFQGINFSSISCGCEILVIAVLPGIVGVAFGIVGGAFALVWKRAGGLILLVATAVAISPWLLILGFPNSSGIPFGFYAVYFAWWNALILFGGLLAFPRTRRILKRLHNEGGLP